MSLVVWLIIIGLVVVVVVRASEWRRVDAPVNPPGVVRIRRRYDFWWLRISTIGKDILFILLGLAARRGRRQPAARSPWWSER